MINRLIDIFLGFDVTKHHIKLPDLPDTFVVKKDNEVREETHDEKGQKPHITSVLIDASKNTYEWPTNDVSLRAELTQEEVRALLENKTTRNLDKARAIKPHINKSASEVQAITGYSNGLVKNHLAVLRRFSQS